MRSSNRSESFLSNRCLPLSDPIDSWLPDPKALKAGVQSINSDREPRISMAAANSSDPNFRVSPRADLLDGGGGRRRPTDGVKEPRVDGLGERALDRVSISHDIQVASSPRPIRRLE